MDIRKKNNAKNEEERLYTAKELESEIENALKNAKSEWDKGNEEKIRSERDDAAKLAAMSPEERTRAELEKNRREFDEEKSRYMAEKTEFEAARKLSENNLPISFAKLVSGKDTEETAANIENFKKEFLKAVENGISERLKGGNIKTGSGMRTESDPFLNGFGC